MDKNKIIKLVNSHHSLFCLCSKVYNNISLKNKITNLHSGPETH